MKNWRTTVPAALFVFYFLLLTVFLLAELGVPRLERLRVTDQVLLLLGLLFLPFLLMAFTPFIRALTFRVSGQEIHVEMGDLHAQIRRVQDDASRNISTAEQALWPILAGEDESAPERWSQRRLVIGSKLDLSQAFFAHLLAEWITRHLPEVQCETRVPNGGSLKNFADLKYHWIDLYIDYTGTGCQYFGIGHRGRSEEEILGELNRRSAPAGIRWLRPLGATEDYLLVMREESAAKYKISSLEDLIPHAPKLVFCADPEFLNRRDCYLGLVSEYNLQFERVEPCRVTSRFSLLDAGEADVAVGYETDPQLKRKDLRVIEDTRHFFPKYTAVPVVAAGALEKIEGLERVLNSLRISTPQLIEQVRRVKNPHRGESPAEVARSFIQKLPPPSRT